MAIQTQEKLCKTFQITDNEKYGKIQNYNNFVELEIISEKGKKRLIQKKWSFPAVESRDKKCIVRDKNDELWLNPIWQIVSFCIKYIVS